MLRRVLALILPLAAFSAGWASPYPAAAQLAPGPGGRAPYANQQTGRNEPGQFDYYALVLSWSPTFCASNPRSGSDPQCQPRDGRRFAFVLHGLWPQHATGWPENCQTRDRPFVPQRLIDSMLDIMPSPRLVIHEYRKHGTCSGLSPDAYYSLSRKLFHSIKVPPRYDGPSQAFTVSPSELVHDFVSVNPELRPEMIAVACGGSGNRLREIRICMSRDGQPQSCGRNEEQRRLCSTSRMYVPPVRERGAEPPVARDRPASPARPGGDGAPFPEQRPLPGPFSGERRI